MVLFKCSNEYFKNFVSPKSLPVNTIVGKRGLIDQNIVETIYYLNQIIFDSRLENELLEKIMYIGDKSLIVSLREVFKIDLNFLNQNTDGDIIVHFKKILLENNILVVNSNNSNAFKMPIKITSNSFFGLSATYDKKSIIFIRNRTNTTAKRYLMTLLINIIAIVKNDSNKSIEDPDNFNLASSILLTEADIYKELGTSISKNKMEDLSKKCKLSCQAIIYRLYKLRKIDSKNKDILLNELGEYKYTKKKSGGGGIKYTKGVAGVFSEDGLRSLNVIYKNKRDFCAKVFNEPVSTRGKDYEEIKKIIFLT